MPRPGIELLIQRPAVEPAATRADVAVFAGLIRRRRAPLPPVLRAALAAAGWRPDGAFAVDDGRLAALLGIPVPVESWAEFDGLFDWTSGESVPGAGDRLPCPLGLAVRQFFLQGGIRAWIVRCGDPLPLSDPQADPDSFRTRQLTALAGPIPAHADAQPILPGLASRSSEADPLDPATWRGAAAVFAIDDAAMLLLPDLPQLAGGPAETVAAVAEPPGPPERFRPCAADVAEAPPEPRDGRPLYRAPRLDRDVMVVAGLPIPRDGPDVPHGAEQWPLGVLAHDGNAGSDRAPLAPLDAAAIGNPRLQLGYPWLATPDAARCPEGLQSPEGSLAGLIARSALETGAFRSAAGRRLTSPARLAPAIPGSDLDRGLAGRADWLGDRLCLFAERRGAIELISDATAAADRAWRKGGVSRLIAVVLRACRHLGDELLFEPAGPALWARAEARVTAVLERMRALGAFDGTTARDSYRVACDRTTMTAADIDAGRVRCEIVVNPASPVERIVVTLALLEPAPAPVREAA